MVALILLFLLLPANAARAHPGVGIVMDSRGNVYYTDLRQVWRIARDGSKSVVVRGVHTHELCLDAQDRLYGEHLWYEGDATKKWGHYVWRLSPTGVLDTVVKPTEGFLTDYSFVRDSAGNMYWVDRGSTIRIRRTTPDGRVEDVSRDPLVDVGWITVDRGGVVYVVDDVTRRGAVRRIDGSGRMTTLATGLAENPILRAWASGRHRLMGIWLGPSGDVYVASHSTGEVKRIGGAALKTVARIRFPWSPTGGLVAPNGDLWILEYRINAARVQRIARHGSVTTF